MAKQYKIRTGFSFVGADRKVIGGGEIVTLEDDVAAGQLHKLEEVRPEATAPAKKPAPKPKTTEAPADPVQTSAQDGTAADDLLGKPADAQTEQPADAPAE